MNFFLILAVLQVADAGALPNANNAANAANEKAAPTTAQTAQQHTVPKPVLGKTVPAVPSTKILSVETNIIAKTNARRIRNGKRPLKLDESLMRSARQHCTWMARNRSLQHTRAAVAENIAMGQSTSTEAVQDWMNSPGHRANMLNGQYTRIGVAAYRAHDGRVYWCQQFLQ